MERYREYKESGVQNLGKVPIHWEFCPLKRICTMKSGNNITSNDIKEKGLYPVFGANGKRGFYDDYNVEGNYLLIGRQGALSGNVHHYNGKFWATDHALITSVNKGNFEYIYYSLIALNLNQYAFGKAAQPGLAASKILSLYITFPPLAEQEKIVSYLEDKTSKIDAYVAEKEKEIQLLQELKQKTIANAVTKGLSPDVRMKDSDISWIGNIPEHWETKRAKFMFKKNKRERRPEDEVITCFRDGQVTLRKNRRLTGFTESEKYDGYQGVRKGDLVIHQMDAFAGSIGVSESDGMGTSVYHCCTPIGDYSVYYYAHLIRQMALSGFIQSLYKGIRERSSDFSFPVFGNQYLLIPPRMEQDAIVAYIDEKCQKIDTLMSELQAEIDNMKEYKQRLIADCVTGQVNVQDKA